MPRLCPACNTRHDGWKRCPADATITVIGGRRPVLTVSSPEYKQAQQEVNRVLTEAVNNVPVNKPVNDRKAYMREYMRKRRMGAERD